MAQLYRVGNPIDREERANLNLTLDDIQSRFSLLQSQVNFLAGGADIEELIQEVNQAIEDANNATENVDNALILVDDKLQELELELAKVNELKPVGEWNASTPYKQNNIVNKDGTSYIALVDNTNVDVTNTSTWQVLSAKGEKGETGKGLTIKGTLTNPSQLPSTGEEGDAYYVDTDLYVWIVDRWENIGQIKGDPGSDANVTTANIENALGYTPANNSVLETFKTQYEFRTATISGRQIRITKPDGSNRIPIYLGNDIASGANITVSLNGGSTSLPLRNVDGTNVTKLEKGFIEIVQTGNFFTLRNLKGGINQSDLDELIRLVNEAEINESTLRTEYINTVNGLDVLTPLSSNSTWNEVLLKLPEINSSKKIFRSGTKVSTSEQRTFRFYDGSGDGVFNFLEVSDFDFMPSRIDIFPTTGFTGYTYYFSNKGLNRDNYIGYTPEVESSGNAASRAFRFGLSWDENEGAVVRSGFFRLPVQRPNFSYTYNIYS